MLGGDVMLNGISVKQKPLAALSSLTGPAGAAIVNLEIPLTTAKSGTPHKSADAIRRRSQFVLKADPNHVAGIAAIGVDLVSLGNNHAMDYRQAGLDQMRAALTKYGVLHTGAGANLTEAFAPAIHKTPTGVRIGLISSLAFMSPGGLGACTPASAERAGVATLGFGGKIDKMAKERLATLIGGAKERCDILVVGLHWGIERQTVPTPYQVALARACVDAGADVVWGHHPHVLQGAEYYRGKPILYSTGNLVSSKPGPTGMFKLVYRSGSLTELHFLPLSIAGGKVKPVNGAPGQQAAKQFKALCASVQSRYGATMTASIFSPGTGPVAIRFKADRR